MLRNLLLGLKNHVWSLIQERVISYRQITPTLQHTPTSDNHQLPKHTVLVKLEVYVDYSQVVSSRSGSLFPQRPSTDLADLCFDAVNLLPQPHLYVFLLLSVCFSFLKIKLSKRETLWQLSQQLQSSSNQQVTKNIQ